MLLKVGFDCLLLWSQYLRDKAGKKESLLYTGGWQPGERADSCPKVDDPPSDNRWARIPEREFQGCMGGGRGLQAETAQSALIVILKGVSFSYHCEAEFTKHWTVHPAAVWSTLSWLFWVQLLFSSRVDWFPFLWGQFLELWQPVSWLPSGLHAVNFFHLVRVSASIRQFHLVQVSASIRQVKGWLRILSTAQEEELRYSPRGGLYFMTKLLLFWLFTFASAFSHLSN